jgi:hypothetical protein
MITLGYMKKLLADILISIAILIGLFALASMFTPTFAMNTDHKPCGQNAEKVTYITATQYYLFSSPYEPNLPKPDIGTCPYEYHEARTLALELWAMVVLFLASAVGIARNNSSTKNRKTQK